MKQTFSLCFSFPNAYLLSSRLRTFKWNILPLWKSVNVYGLLAPARRLFRTKYTPSVPICFKSFSASSLSKSWNQEKLVNIKSSTFSSFGIGGKGRSLMTVIKRIHFHIIFVILSFHYLRWYRISSYLYLYLSKKLCQK